MGGLVLTFKVRNTVLPASLTPGQRGRPPPETTINHFDAVSTNGDHSPDNNHEARFPLHITGCLELASKNSF